MTDAFQRPEADAASIAREDGEIERAVPASQQLQDSVQRVATVVRSSVPLRTVAFVLPPLVLPLALGLSFGATLAVALVLLWLAAASATLATLMFDGSDQLALRAIERRLEQLAGTGTFEGATASENTEALMAIGAQLDAMSDRLDELVAASAPPAAAPDRLHRPPEHWSTSQGGEQNDRYDRDVVSERPWSQPRWQR
ncbi:MAG: hypothetical protein KY460_07165 [Actinobacteria bacterium]|nr:hypothetical protein [Actinomycetota bacterium]